MDLLLPGMQPALARWDGRPFSPAAEAGPGPADHRDVYEKEIAREAPGDPEADGPHRRVGRAILRYEIFPPWLVRGVVRRVPLEVGDTVGIHYTPLPGLGMFFAARVIERHDGPAGAVWRTGFRYRTLRGHPELGEETFCVEKDRQTGRVIAALRSWSRPGMLLTRLAAPMMRMAQVRASRAALDQLARAAR